MKRQRFLALLLSAVIAFAPAVEVIAEEDVMQEQTVESDDTEDANDINNVDDLQNDSVVEENEDTIQTYNNEGEQNEIVGGYIPSKLDYDTPVYYGENSIQSRAASYIPAKYPEGGVEEIKATYPVNRDQGRYGTCWAFSSIGLAEFDLLNDEMVNNTGKFNKDKLDLSELQLAYFTYNFVTDPLGGTEGDIAKYYNENTNTTYLARGGNYDLSSRRLSQWVGAVNENDVPYDQAESVLQNGLDDKYAYNYDVAHLENAYLINIKQNASDVKRQIMEHGAAGIMYTHHFQGFENDTYYDTENTYVGYSDGGHAVMIVGWDDNISKDSFSAYGSNGIEKPTNDGAWLVRNSWGSDKSYFWMSYETKSLTDTAWIFDFDANDGYDNNYQVDAAISASPSFSSTQVVHDYKKVCNIFSVSEKNGVASEILKAVSLSMRSVTSVGYKIEIYTDVPYDDNAKIYRPEKGTLQSEATTEGTTTYAGYYTIPLKNEVELTPGTNYAVVVTVDKEALDYEYATSEGDLDSNKTTWDCRASIANGKSMIFVNYLGKPWSNWSLGNFCIKAFTSNNQEETGLGDKLYGRSLTLNGSIEVNFYMELPESIVQNENAYMEFTTEDGTVHNVAVSEATIKKFGDKTYYVFKCPVYAMEMTDKISAHMVVDGKSGEIYTYSVKQYSDQILQGQNSYTDETKNVIKAMLNYGAAAQVQFEYKADTLANENLNDTEKMITDADFNNYINSRTIDENIKGISCYGTSLVLNSETSLRHYFQLESGYEIGDYNFQYTDTDGNVVKLEPKQKSGSTDLYYIEIPNIKAYELNQMPKTIVQSKEMADGNRIEITYGPFSYCYNVVNNQSTEKSLKNLANTLYWYWYYADAYVKSQGY